jgi:hypothetical protein
LIDHLVVKAVHNDGAVVGSRENKRNLATWVSHECPLLSDGHYAVSTIMIQSLAAARRPDPDAAPVRLPLRRCMS